MRVLGVVLAGGASRRFGSDKARAVLSGKPLIVHVIDRLRPQVDAVIVAGREWPGTGSVLDRPGPGLGPLGGLNAALGYGAALGFEAVLTSGCDLLDLPQDLRTSLGQGPSFALGQPLLGLWPVAFAAQLDHHLRTDPDRSLRRWIAVTGARTVDVGPVVNINFAADLPH